MKRWVVATKRADFNALAEKFHITPMLARILRNRDLTSEEEIERFLNGTLDDLHDPMLLDNLDMALSLIKGAIEGDGQIRVIGDYDVDGICATYILVKTLKACGANVSWQLPDRVRDGYGLNRNIIEKAHDDGITLLLTCDNGIAAVDEIAYAKELGICVVVTDHHEPQEVLPDADALVNPKIANSSYPYRDICGAVVAYKLAGKLCEMMGAQAPDDQLEFAAFATVCDVMPLLDENHLIVKYGIEKIKQTTNLGLNTLIDVTGCDRSKFSVYHFGFILGPCVNATGRLDVAGRALELFLTDDERQAALIAQELKALNESRKNMTDQCTRDAIRIVSEGDANNPKMTDDKVLLVYLPDCHESIAGIVAGKVREQYYRPTIVLTRSENPGADGTVIAKGSARSIEAYDMFAGLQKVGDLLEKFGGHKMAAGLSLSENQVAELRRRLNEQAELSEEDLIEKVTIDIAMPMRYATESFTEELDRLSPYGVGNPRPLFAQKDLVIKSILIQGKKRNAIKLTFEGEGAEGCMFGDGDAFLEEYHKGDKVAIVYTPEINAYMGRRSVQMSIKEIRPDT